MPNELEGRRRDVLKSIGAGTALLVGGSATVAAGPNDDSVTDNAEVRVIHASPDAPAVDVFVDGGLVLEDVPFKTVSDYLSVPPGEYDVAVAPADAGIENAVIDTTLELAADTDYTVAATNELGNIEPSVFVDDNDEGQTGQASLRVVHLSPDAPAVDIAQTEGPGVGAEPEVVVEGLPYRTASGYLDLPPSSYEFEVRAAGDDEGVFSFPFDPEPGATYTAFAVGLLETDTDAQSFDVVSSEDVPPNTERGGSGRGNDTGNR